MAEPLTIIGGVGSILQIISSVTKLSKSLNEVRESYDNVALNTTLVASQLSTIRAALEALHAWRASDKEETEASLQLDQDLGLSLSCCAVLITVIDSKLTESGYQPGFGLKQKIKYIWLEDILKEYVSNLEGQVRALQLLLTIFQCRTATEQKQELARLESRAVIEKVRAETMTLGIGESEMDDAISILSQDPSITFDVESILMKSPAYKRVYGDAGRPRRRYQKARKDDIDSQNAVDVDLAKNKPAAVHPPSQSATAGPAKIAKAPPPPPPPRRKRVAPSIREPEQSPPKSESPPLPAPDHSLPPEPPAASAPEQSLPSPEIAPQPPPLPTRPKRKSEASSQTRMRAPSQENPRSQGRINVWDFLGPGQQAEASDSFAMVMADSAPVFELPAEPSPANITLQEPSKVSATVFGPVDSSLPAQTSIREFQASETLAMPSSYENLTNGETPAIRPRIEVEKHLAMIHEPPSSLDGFKNQLALAFEDSSPSQSSSSGLRLSFTPSEPKDSPLALDVEEASSPTEEMKTSNELAKEEEALHTEKTLDEIAEGPAIGTGVHNHEGVDQDRKYAEETIYINDEIDVPATSSEPKQVAYQRMSITSSVDLYEASVRNVPLEKNSRPPSTQSALVGDADEQAEAASGAVIDDDLEAEEEGLSVLNQQLACKVSDTQATTERAEPTAQCLDESLGSIPNQSTNIEPEEPVKTLTKQIEPVYTPQSSLDESFGSIPNQSTNIEPEKPVETLVKQTEPVHTPQSSLVLSPLITMTPSDDYVDHQTIESPTARDLPRLASPNRAPPLPPTHTASIPPIPQHSPPVFYRATRNSGIETSTVSTGRDSSIVETASTISSSEHSMDNSMSTMQQSTSNTTATSMGFDGQTAAREQAQAELRRLQDQLATAKKSGDSSAAQASLQKSIEVIRNTYLGVASAPVETKKSRSPRLGSRASILRLPSLPGALKGTSTALGDAAAAGDLETVRQLVDLKGVDARTDNYKTPLMRAALNGHIDCMELLKQKGADEFAVDTKGRNVLHIAIANNQLPVLKWLVNAYPPQRPETLRHKSSILSKATSTIITRSPRNLREASDSEGSRPLHIAAAVDEGCMVQTLLDAGVEIESKNSYDRTPLHQAVIWNRPDSFDTLLRKGANIQAVDAQSMTPLHLAAKTGQANLIQALLEKGARRNDFDYSGNQPIHQAAWVGYTAGIEKLVLGKEDLEAKTRNGESLLHIACLTKNVGLGTWLLQKGVEVNPWAPPQPSLLNALDKFKLPLTSLTPLHYASCQGNYEMAILLLDSEAWVNAPTPDGVTPLMMATESEDTNTVNLLLTRGAKVNAMMPGTLITALHIAARRGDLDTVQQLCRSNANDSARANNGSYGRTPAEECAAKCSDKIKRHAVEEYFRTVRENRWRNSRIKANAARHPQPYETVGRANSTAPPNQFRNPHTYSYQPLPGQPQPMPLVQQAGQWVYQPSATYPPMILQQPLQPQMAGQPLQQWYDTGGSDPLTQVESPPPYDPGGASLSARLAAQAPVHRPGDTTAPTTVTGPRYPIYPVPGDGVYAPRYGGTL